MLGEVPDALKFMNSKAIMVVPLLSGSGMRIKILEAMAMHKGIVSTALGADGIPAPEAGIMLAETPEDFVAAISELVENPDLVKQKGMAGRRVVEEHFENKQLGIDLLEFFEREL